MRWQNDSVISIILCCIAVFLFSSCQEKSPISDAKVSDVTVPNTTVYESAKPIGLSFPIEELSDPFYFDQDAAVFQTFFPMPSSATFQHDDIQEEISAEDPRLNRLMNLIEFSWKNGKTIWLQGIVPEEEIEEWLNQELPLLIIHFSQDSESEGFDPINQIMICGAECLVEYPEQDGIRMIEEHWPCAQYLCDMESDGSITEDEYSYYLEYAKDDPWFDILAYTGFQSGD